MGNVGPLSLKVSAGCGGVAGLRLWRLVVSSAQDDVRQRLGHVKGSSGGGSRRVQPHTLGNTIARADITSMKQVKLRHLSIKSR